jgi:hypothetical protein
MDKFWQDVRIEDAQKEREYQARMHKITNPYEYKTMDELIALAKNFDQKAIEVLKRKH